LVFRNDPLESLKVSSTFDSIQFVRDYLQRTIEVKLRDLMMDELPAIIHRLSLQLWCPDQIPKEDDELREDDEPAVNPLATPPLDAVDSSGHLLDAAEISSLSLDGGPETQSLFSQKNLSRLGGLTNSDCTSSLFTPSIQHLMFRAWAGPSDRIDAFNTPPLSTPGLIRSSSYYGSSHTYAFSDSSSQDHGYLPSRPSMVSLSSATTGLSLGSGRHSKTGRKKKNRVVNLRRKTGSETSSEAGDSTSETTSMRSPLSEPIMPIREEPEEELAMAANSMPNKVRFRAPGDVPLPPPRASAEPDSTIILNAPISYIESHEIPVNARQSFRLPQETRYTNQSTEKAEASSVDIKSQSRRPGPPRSDTSSVILEQAWIMKMAGEIARRVYDEKNRNPAFWADREDTPPPAYEARSGA
jgi:mitochondrial distribution and morphology protein 34